jgi:hypothetical protein
MGEIINRRAIMKKVYGAKQLLVRAKTQEKKQEKKRLSRHAK